MTGRSEKQKMLAGGPCHAGDIEVIAEHQAALEWMERYNGAAARSARGR